MEEKDMLTRREQAVATQAEEDEQRLLKIIEDSFCVAGYEVLDSEIFKESIKQVKQG
jgi:hypothetical protein